MSWTLTPNYNLVKPNVGTEIDTWGPLINADMDTIDAAIFEVASIVNGFNPYTYGAIVNGLGAFDDTSAINAMSAAALATIDTPTDTRYGFMSLVGKKFKVTSPINLTHFRSQQTAMLEKGIVLAQFSAPGGAVLDLTGSQSFNLRDLVVSTEGAVNFPDYGVVWQRYNPSGGGSTVTVAGNHADSVMFRGTYRKAAGLEYAAELFTSIKGEYANDAKWAQYPNSYSFILAGNDLGVHFYDSTFLNAGESTATGVQSFNNKQFYKLRLLRTNPTSWVTTAVDKSATPFWFVDFSGGVTPVIGDLFTIEQAAGMTQLNDKVGRVGAVTSTGLTTCKFLLLHEDGTPWDTSSYGVYTSGAKTFHKTGPCMLLIEDDVTEFKSLYCQTYGSDAVEVKANGAGKTSRYLKIQGHCEGAAIQSWLYFNFGTNNQTFTEFEFYEHQSQVIGTLFRTNATSGFMEFGTAKVVIGSVDNVQAMTALFDTPSKYFFHNIYLEIPDRSLVPSDFSAFGKFTGTVYIRNEDAYIYIRQGKTLYTDLIDQTLYAEMGTRILGNLGLYGNGTNLLFRSEEADNAYWNLGGATVTPNATTDPNGASTADSLIEDTSLATTHSISKNTIASSDASQLQVISTVVKASTRNQCQLMCKSASGPTNNINAEFDLSTGRIRAVNNSGNGTQAKAGMIPLHNGWWRIWVSGIPDVTLTPGTTAARYELRLQKNGSSTYDGDGSSKLYISWLQHEPNVAFPGPYTKTTSAAITGDITRIFTPNALDIQAAGVTINGAPIGSGGGNVNGPGSSTANALARWNSTGGVLLRDSGWILSDLGILSPVTGASFTNKEAIVLAPGQYLGYGLPLGSNATSNLIAMSAALAQDEVAPIKPGTYVVSSAVTGQTSKNVTWETDFGVSIDLTSATNWFNNRVKPHDLSAVPGASKVIAGGTSAPGNGNLIFQSWRISATGATSSYEKDHNRIGVITEDVSTGVGNGGVGTDKNFDAVAHRRDGYIAAGNTAGRVWSSVDYINIPATSNGSGCGNESDINNASASTPSDPSNGVPFRKLSYHAVTVFGAGTAALRIGGSAASGGLGFYNGVWSDQAGIFNDPSSSFLNLKDFFRVDRNGAILLNNAASGMQGAGTINISSKYYVNGLQVVQARDTGWALMTGTPVKTSIATGSATLPQLAGVVMALQAAMNTHGLIGA